MRVQRVALLAAVTGSLALASPQDVPVETIRTMNRSLGLICCGYRDEKLQLKVVSRNGTGFFINRSGEFLTAAHVVFDCHSKNLIIGICVPKTGWQTEESDLNVKCFPQGVCVLNAELDIARCKPNENPFHDPEIKTPIEPASLESARPKEGSAVAFTGFPLQFGRPVTSKGFIAGYADVHERFGVSTMILDKSSWPGSSGSPVYSPEGKVVGVVVKRGVEEAAGLAFAKTSTAIERFLRQQEAPATK